MIETGRGAVAIIAGYAVMTVLVILSTILLAVVFGAPRDLEPSQTYIVGTLVCGFLAAIAGGWTAARMAPRRPLLHAAILAALVAGIGLILATGEPQAGQPGWYPAAILALGAAGAFLGGLIRARRVEPVHP